MRTATSTTLLAVAVSMLVGCGTVVNLAPHTDSFDVSYVHVTTDRATTYGGVYNDWQYATKLLENTTGISDNTAGLDRDLVYRSAQLVITPYVLLVDLPLSVIADTLTLPYVVSKQVHELRSVEPLAKLRGYWKIPNSTSHDDAFYAFYYDGKTVTLYAHPKCYAVEWGWYCMAAQFENNVLSVYTWDLLGSMAWRPVATFKDGRFVAYDGVYQRVQPSDLAPDQRPLLSAGTVAEAIGVIHDTWGEYLHSKGIIPPGPTCLKELTELNLAGTHVTDAELKHLYPLTKLQHVNLANTKVSDEGIRELQKAMPELRIER